MSEYFGDIEAHLVNLIQRYWGFETFREGQLELIQRTIKGLDSIVLFPTGGGKSLCFQIPALYFEGISIVISPLIALMNDQVKSLRHKGISAVALNSSLNSSQQEIVRNNLRLNKYKLLYLSPERFISPNFQRFIPSLNIAQVAIDEAHCVSIWGHDFRPSYLRLAENLRELNVPKIALTATATMMTLEDIKSYLSLSSPKTIQTSFKRSNLAFAVCYSEYKLKWLHDFFKVQMGCSIIYVRSRRTTMMLGQRLAQMGCNTTVYHAGLSKAQREKSQSDWMNGRSQIMVSTNAFGMGIDKGDVRNVVHFDPPPSLEDYYQEAGRAGRDRAQARAVLLYNNDDLAALQRDWELSYPSDNQLLDFYKSILNFLEVPIGFGKDQAFEFYDHHFHEFTGYSRRKIYFGLEALRKIGLVRFSDSFFQHTKIQIIRDKRSMFEFYEDHEDKKEFIQAILRKYEGVFTLPTRINELDLANQLGMEQGEVIKNLRQLAEQGFISLSLNRKEKAIIFNENRIPISQMEIRSKEFRKLQQSAKTKIEKIIEYVKFEDCSQNFIIRYLDQGVNEVCGICHNCKSNVKNDTLELSTKIATRLKKSPIALKALLEEFSNYSDVQILQVVRDFQSEERLGYTDSKLFWIEE